MKNLVKCHKVNPSENRSIYVGTNYKDEPTHDSEKGKQSQDNQNNFRNGKKLNRITNGFN
jgi:hypothetical protein